MFARILKVEVELVADIVSNASGYCDATRLGDPFDPRGDVDAVAENVVILNDDIAKIDADAKHDPPILGYAGGSHLDMDVVNGIKQNDVITSIRVV